MEVPRYERVEIQKQVAKPSVKKAGATGLHSRKLTWKPKKGPLKTTVLLKGTIWVSMLVWGV